MKSALLVLSLTHHFLDRNGKHFGSILNFLRDGQIPLPDTRRELLELQAEITIGFFGFFTQIEWVNESNSDKCIIQ